MMSTHLYDPSVGHVTHATTLLPVNESVRPSSPIEQAIANVLPRLEEARTVFAGILALETRLRLHRDELLTLSLRLGRLLVGMKEEIGHGRWLAFLEGRWPQLGERNAQRCMMLARENPESVDSTDLSADSVRKFMWGYLPEKERPEIEGDGRVPAGAHPLTVVNHFFKWTRQMRVGAVKAPPPEVMRREFEPVVRELIGLIGPEWFREMLDTAPAPVVPGAEASPAA